MAAAQPDSPEIDLALLKRLEGGMRAAMAEGRERHRAAGFEVFLSPDSDDYLLSVALPAPAAAPPWDASIAALLAVYAPTGRRPRLESFAELHPSLAPALTEAGFVEEMRAPVMVLAPGELAPGSARSGIRLLSHRDPESLKAFLGGQGVAFGGSPGAEALAWYPSLLAGLERGTVMAALLEEDGEPLSGATLIRGGEIAELAGVWTLPERRRQGLAFAVCRQLLTHAFAQGLELCWLSAAEEGLGVYRRLGFERVGTQLNHSKEGRGGWGK